MWSIENVDMIPVLFTIGPFNVYAFGFFLALSFLLSTFIVWKFAREEGKETEYFDAFLYTNIVAVIFARIGYIIFHPQDFGFNILRFLVVRETPGLSLLSGCVAGVIYLYIYARMKKYNFAHLTDLFSVAFSFCLIFVKIGEQLGGAGFGRESSWPFAVKIVGLTGRRQPVEAYEALVMILISIILLILFRKAQRRDIPRGITAIVCMGLTALTAFSLEFLKVSQVYLSYFTLRQWMSIGILLLSIILFILKIRITKQVTKK